MNTKKQSKKEIKKNTSEEVPDLKKNKKKILGGSKKDDDDTDTELYKEEEEEEEEDEEKEEDDDDDEEENDDEENDDNDEKEEENEEDNDGADIATDNEQKSEDEYDEISDAGEEIEGCIKEKGRKKKQGLKDIIELDIIDDIDKIPLEEKKIPDEDRIMYPEPRLSKYELTKLVSIRAMQISSMSMIFIKGYEGLTPKQIAFEEIKNGKCGLLIKRPFPDKTYELWRLDELDTKSILKNYDIY